MTIIRRNIIRRTVTALGITTLAASSLGFGAGTASAADAYAVRSDSPPPTIGELVVEKPTQESTTCEGNINCRLLEGACDLVGGQYNGWESSDHGHTHGVCTWPWE